MSKSQFGHFAWQWVELVSEPVGKIALEPVMKTALDQISLSIKISSAASESALAFSLASSVSFSTAAFFTEAVDFLLLLSLWLLFPQ